jgi:hypothetical protein
VEVLQTILSELVEPADGPREHASKLFSEVAQFPAFKNIKNGDLFSLSLANKNSARTHGFHRFPAKYIPRVPAWALDQFAASDSVVLDPFCGSGTTLVEALSHTRQVIGLDCDPLACLISRAKTTAVSPSRVQELAANLRRNWSKTVTEKISLSWSESSNRYFQPGQSEPLSTYFHGIRANQWSRHLIHRE